MSAEKSDEGWWEGTERGSARIVGQMEMGRPVGLAGGYVSNLEACGGKGRRFPSAYREVSSPDNPRTGKV